MIGISINRIGVLLRNAALAALVLFACALSSGAAAEEPDFSFDLPQLGTWDDYTFEDLTEELPLVIHLWGPDCPYCLAHMPYAAALYRKLDLDEVTYVSFSITGDKDDIAEYLDEHELSFLTLVGEDGEYGEGWEEEGWPTTYVFAPGAELIGWCDTVGPAYLTEMLELVEQAMESCN